MKSRLLRSTALVGFALFAFASPASAACDDNAPGNNVTVTCTGADNVGVAGLVSTGVTVNLDNNATVTGDGNSPAIQLGDNATVTLGTNATVNGNGDAALNFTGNGNITTGAGSSLIGGNVMGGGAGDTVNFTLGGNVDIFGFNNTIGNLNLLSTFSVGTLVDGGGGGTDTLTLTGTTNGAFDTDDIGTELTNFETFAKSGSSTWTLSGTNAQNWSITGGKLIATTANITDAAISAGAALEFQTGGTYNGALSGAGDFIKNGGATLTLTGNNDNTGALIVQNATTLNVANALTFDNVSGVSVDQSTFQFGSSFSTDRNFTIGVNDATLDTQAFNNTISGNIDGAGTLVKGGTGALTLTGTGTYADGIVVNAGRLIGNTTNLVGNSDIAGGAFLRFNQTSGGTYAGNIIGGGTLEKIGAANLTLSGTNTYSGGTTVTAGSLTGNTTSLQGAITNNASVIFDQSANGTYGGIMGGTGSLTKTGTADLILGAANTYSGKTLINAGTVEISASNNLGNAAGTNFIEFNGGTLRYAASITNNRNVTLTGAGTIDTAGTTVVMNGDFTGSGDFTKAGAGTLDLAGANGTFTGQFNFNGGTVLAATTATLGDGSGTNALSFNGGEVKFGSDLNTGRAVTINAGGGIINTDNHTDTFSGVISGVGKLSKAGGGVLILSNTNTYQGGTDVNEGTLRTTADANLGNVNGNIFINNTAIFQFGATYSTARDFDIGAANGTIDTNGFNGTISGDLSGTGRITKTGAGTLTLTGASTKTNGFTVSTGTLTGTTDNLTGNITNSSILRINQATNGTYASVLSGAGTLHLDGAGVITLTGTNTFSGAIHLNGSSTLTATVNANLGDGSATNVMDFNGGSFKYGAAFNNNRAITLTGSGTIDTNGFNTTQTGDISGASNLVKAGPGILTLSAVNTYSGRTVINGGTVRAAATANLGNAAGTNDITLDGGTLEYTGAFNMARDVLLGAGNGTINLNANNVTISGVFSGAGNLTKSGSGTLTLSGVNTNSGGVIVSAGTLVINAGSGLGDGSGTNLVTLDGTTLRYGASFTMAQGATLGASNATFNSNGFNNTISGTIGGAGKLIKTGAGALTLTGTNNYTGGNDVQTGALSGTSNSIKGNTTVAAGAQLEFNQGFNGTFAGNVSGNGSIQKIGTGTLTLTGTNTQTDGTVFGGGTIAAASTSALGTGGTWLFDGGALQTTASFTDNHAITITGNDGTVNTNSGVTTTLGGVIGGVGDLTKIGTGTLTLTNTNTYNGATTVSAGKLIVNGAAASSATTVGASGILGGSGTVGALTMNGTVTPGNSIGTLHVTGGVTFNSGSVYEVELDDAGNSDLIDATGAITINGGSVVTIGTAGTYSENTIYTILHGASVAGTFTGGISTNLAFLDPTLVYNATTVQISMDRNDTDFSEVARDPEQAQVANAVTDLGAGNDIFDAFTGLTEQEARDALDDLSGEHNAGVAGALAQSVSIVQDNVMSHMTGLMHHDHDGDVAALAPVEDPSVYTAALFEPSDGAIGEAVKIWMEAIGAFGQSNSHGATPQQDRHSYGALAGVDVPFDDKGWYGFFGGYETGELETDSQGASSQIGSYHLGAYATRPLNNDWTLSGGITGAYHDINSVRYVVFPGFEAAPHGDTAGQTFSGFAEVAHTMDMHGLALEPFANLSVTYSHMDGYTETQGGAANLTVDSVNKTWPATTLGFRTGKSVGVGEGKLNLNASLGWQHVYGDTDNQSDMRFAGGTTTFESFGPARDRDAAVVGVGVDATIGAGGKAYIGYNGTLSANAQDHGFKAGLKCDF